MRRRLWRMTDAMLPFGVLLRRYERARRADVLAMSLTTDGLQQLFSQTVDPIPTLRNWGMRGFNQTQLLKNWIARQAMGLR